MYPSRENSDAILSVLLQNPLNRQSRFSSNFHGPMELPQFVCPRFAQRRGTGLSSFREPGLHFSVHGDQDLLSPARPLYKLRELGFAFPKCRYHVTIVVTKFGRMPKTPMTQVGAGWKIASLGLLAASNFLI
jgi:hypothetical protein